MSTFRFSVVQSLPSAIRLKEYIAPDAAWSFAELPAKQAALTGPNAMLSRDCQDTNSNVHRPSTAERVARG